MAATAGIVAGAATAGVALYKVGEEFDKAYDTIQSSTGKTGRALEGLKADFKNVVAGVPADFQDAAKAVSFLNQRLNLTGKPLQKLSKQTLELSRMTGTDLADNLDNVTKAFADFQVPVRKQAGHMDRLWRVSQATGVSISDLTSYMYRFGSPLRQLGFNFDTTAAMFGKFIKEGVNVRTMIPGLRLALGRFAEAGKDPVTALQKLFQEIRNAGSAGDAYRLKLGDLGTVLEVFGRRAGPDMVQAIQEGRFSFQDLLKVMRDGDSTILGTAKKTRDMSEEWRLFVNRLKVFVEPAATWLFHRIGQMMAAVNRILSDKKLSPAEKIGKLLSEAGKGLAKLGAQAAGMFVRAFLQADVWGQLLMTGALIRLIGGKGALGSVGKAIGRQILAGVATTKLGATVLSMLPGVAVSEASGEASGEAWGQGFILGLVSIVGGGLILGKFVAKLAPDISAFSEGYIQRQFGYTIRAIKGTLPTLSKWGVSVAHAFSNPFKGGLFPRLGETLRDKLLSPLRWAVDKVGGIFGGMKDKAISAFNTIKGPIVTVAKVIKGALMWIVRAVATVIRKLGHLKDALPDNPGDLLPDINLPGGGFTMPLPGGSVHIGQKGLALVPGTGSGDKVPVHALLEPGEAFGVINRNAVRHIMEANARWPRMADGGLIDLENAALRGPARLAKALIRAARRAKTTGQIGGGSPGQWRPIDALARQWGLGISSSYRPGDTDSWHGVQDGPGRGRATDYSDGYATHNELVFARKMARRYGSHLLELIHTPLGFGIKNGQRVAPYAAADHYDHVHVAFQKGGVVTRGRVSWFTGPGGAFTDHGISANMAGIAMNLRPGTDAGWKDPRITKWALKHKLFQVVIAGHSARLPIVDKGPAGSTGRAIDVTAAGVRRLGFTTHNFPTDARGVVSFTGGNGNGDGNGKDTGVAVPLKLLERLHRELIRPSLDKLRDAIHTAKVAVKRAKGTKTAADDIAAFTQLHDALTARSGFDKTLDAWKSAKRSGKGVRKALEALVAAEQALFPAPEATESEPGAEGQDYAAAMQALTDELRKTREQRELTAALVGPVYAGQYDQGGVVPGPRGARRIASVRAGETIIPEGEGGIAVLVTVEDGAVDKDKIRAEARAARREDIANARRKLGVS